jgi:hypothetical protein
MVKNPNEIKKQTHIDSGNVTPEEAAEMSKAEKWAPHVSDGLDALEKALFKAEVKKWSQVVADARNDYKFRKRLMQDPQSALKEFGIEIPSGVEFRIVENTDKVRYITLPQKSGGDATELPSGELEIIAAGITSSARPRLHQTWADTWIAITDPAAPVE